MYWMFKVLTPDSLASPFQAGPGAPRPPFRPLGPGGPTSPSSPCHKGMDELSKILIMSSLSYLIEAKSKIFMI